jgi:hypothetical protein
VTVNKTTPVARSTVESARLLVETADSWGQPVPDAIRAIARAGEASIAVELVPAAGVILNGQAPRSVTDASRHQGAADRQRMIRRDVERLVRDIEVVQRESPEIFMGLADRPRVDETCCAVR